MNTLDMLHERLRSVIVGTCNTVGCKDCDLKWPESCSALELQNRIFEEEKKEREKKEVTQ